MVIDVGYTCPIRLLRQTNLNNLDQNHTMIYKVYIPKIDRFFDIEKICEVNKRKMKRPHYFKNETSFSKIELFKNINSSHFFFAKISTL